MIEIVDSWTPATVWSGGQTGADQGALRAAKASGIPTQGYMPRGWLTELGSRPDIGHSFHLIEHPSESYPARTRANIDCTDGTLVIGDITSRGSQLALRLCRQLCKPVLTVPFAGEPIPAENVQRVRDWLTANHIGSLNVGGNRESANPGIERATFDFLRIVFAHP